MEKTPNTRMKNKQSINQTTPRSTKTPGKYTSPFKNNKSPVTRLFQHKFDNLMDEDVSLLRQEERSIYDLNDQNIALARVVSNQLSEISILKNQNRISRMEYITAKKALDDRKSQALLQKDDYNDAITRYNKIMSIKESINNEIQSLRQTAFNIQEQLKDIYTQMKPDPETKQQLQLLNFEVTEYRALVEVKKNRIQELQELQAQYMNEIQSLNDQYNQLEEEQKNLKIEKELLITPYEKVVDVLSSSFDPLTNENAYVERIEREIEEWSKRLNQFKLSETTEDVNQAQANLEVLQKENEERKLQINMKKEDLIQANLKVMAASKAVSSTTRYKTTAATVKNTRIRNQHKLAIEIVKDIFNKISQKERNVNAINEEVDKMREIHKNSQAPIIDQYNNKMARVEELTKALSEIDQITIDIARVENERDELKKEEDDMKYELEKFNHVSSNLLKDQEIILKRQNENKKIQENIEQKMKEYEELENKYRKKEKKLKK